MGTIKIGDKKAFLLEPDKIQPVIYSTEEREIGVWTDGKPLYEKVFEFSSELTLLTQQWIVTDFDISYISKIVDAKAINSDGAAFGYISAVKKAENNKLQILQTRNSAISINGIIIQYTKTTDTAGSGTWTPQGVPAVHYSTDEHVIGTWIDGSTLYEKTYDFSSNYIDIPAGTNWLTTDIDSSNIEMITSVFANHSDGTMYNDMSADPTGSNHTKLKLKSAGGASAFYLTIQYTKSS